MFPPFLFFGTMLANLESNTKIISYGQFRFKI